MTEPSVTEPRDRSRLQTIVDALGLRRSIVGVLAMAVLVGMGERMSERFLPVYLLALGAGPLIPGYLNTLNNLIGALYAFPGGWLADRLGVKRALLVFNLLAISGYLVVIAIPRWQAVILGSLLFLSWSSISLPGTMGLISKVLPKQKQVMGVSLHSLVRRIPMALGPIVGGIFIDTWGRVTGVRLAFGAAVVMAVAALIAQQVLIAPDDQSAAPEMPDPNPVRLFRGFSPRLKSLFVSDVLIRFCEQIPYAYVVIWCMEDVAGYRTARVTATEFGLLTSIEMATALLCYVPVARFADKGHKKPFVLITFINFALFPLVLFFSRSFAMLVVAFIVRGLKEFGEPTRKALIMQLAPENRKAAAFGTYYLFRDSLISLAAFAGAFLWRTGAAVNLFSAFAFGIVGAVWFGVFGREE
jgi:MFS family permease